MKLLELLKTRAFEKREVTLASGRKSNFYIDVKRVSLLSEGAYLVGQELFNLIQDKFPSAQAVGGLTLGADPLATAIAIQSWINKKPIHAFIVRKEAKSHGLSKWIEGTEAIPPHTAVVVVEDVVTTGKSSLEAIKRVEEQNWKVLGVAAVVDRQEGGAEKLAQEGYPLFSLYRKSDFGILE